MKTLAVLVVLLAPACIWADAANSQGQPIPLPPFAELWMREKGAGHSQTDAKVTHDGRPSIRIEHTGAKDFSLNASKRIDVAPGDIIEFSAWVRLSKGEGQRDLTLAAMSYDSGNKIVQFSLGRRAALPSDDFKLVSTRIIVPKDVRAITPRVMGHGAVTAWVEGASLKKLGNLEQMRGKGPREVAARSNSLELSFKVDDGAMTFTDRRTGQKWSQQTSSSDCVVTSAVAVTSGIDVKLFHGPTGLDLTAAIRLEADRPEATVKIGGSTSGPMEADLAWPAPFVVEKEQEKRPYLVVPMNEGISYPVDDTSIQPIRLVAYTGHGICMSFYGVTDGQAGQMTILETPDDAYINITRPKEKSEEMLRIEPVWQGQKAQFGYDRKLRFVFFDKGGHVAMAKRYRAYAKEIGLFKTLADKRKEIPSVDKLVGAVNLWCYDRDAVGMVKELQKAGIQRILWSAANRGEVIAQLNAIPDVLTSRYDIYQDAMNPANFDKIAYKHSDWTSSGWPHHMVVDRNGNFISGWGIEAKDKSGMIPCGVLCDSVAIPYAIDRIGEELKTKPYHCRFIDTTTASGWRECWSDKHPMTRGQSHWWKVKLLEVVSGKFKLVCGSETGQDAVVPVAHYFEGMLSLGPYRVPDAGRKTNVIWDEVPEKVQKFQVGHQYRLPLWELVYHDCLVAHWYWGDYNNKLPAIWDKRDQFNALYGTAGMFMFDRKLWNANKDRFVKSYKAWAEIARATGYSEMTDHKFLNPDRSLQQTVFANGVTVTVNFGEQPHRLSDGSTLAPGAVRTTGIR